MSAEGTKMPGMLPCGECGMPCDPREYHPFAACLMFKACHDSDTVRANLEAVRQEATRQAMEEAAKAVRSRKSTMSMFATSRGCIAHNDAVNECEDAIRRALADVDAKEKGNG